MTPFHCHLPDALLADLRARLRNTRWPDDPPGEQAGTGTDGPWLRELVRYWADGFDWRAQEARLNAFPQATIEIGDQQVHFIHQPGRGRRVVPLLLLHGWPGSVWEFHRLIPLLADPAAHGLDDAIAFTVVAPSLPGFVFSHRPGQRRIDRREAADLFRTLMVDVLGYRRFALQGGDLGAHIGPVLAHRHARHVQALHLNFLGFLRNLRRPQQPSAEEAAYFQRLDTWLQHEAGYQWIQGTKPQTLAYALTDSPAGLAAWMAEKFWSWTDHGGDVETALPRDDQLAMITLYWATAAINSSFWLYWTARRGDLWGPEPTRIEVPTAYLDFPKEIMRPPRSIAEQVFDIRRWTVAPGGGHFAALEQPRLLAEDLRSFVAST
ncbi:MAG TPA: epoxide hydrolase [Ramlibacter sp.]|nr:epoxide hydrolase [Ramlibacter sp.]